MIFHRFSLVLAVITVSLFVSLTSGYCQEQETAPEKDVSSLAKLSDEQVRNLLIAELTSKEKEEQATQEFLTLHETIVNWLHLFDADTGVVLESRVDALLGATVHMPEYLLNVFLRFGKGTDITSAIVNVLFIVLIFVIGYLVVLVYKAIVPKFDGHSTEQEIPEMGGYMRFWAGVMRMIFGVTVLAVFTVVVLGIFFSTPLMEIDGSRYLFLAVLLTILILRLGALISHLICSPVVSGLRLLAITDKTARTTHRIILFVLAYVAVGLSTIGVISELGMPENGVYVIIILLGSLLLFLTAGILVANRQTIADYIISAETVDAGGNWVMHQFARLWHILALLYLFSVWAIFLHQQVMGIRSERPAFLLSLLILPLFLVLDRIAHWVVEVSIKLLKIYNDPEEEKTGEESGELTAEEKEKLLIVKVFRWVRIMILLALFGWFLHVWGYSLPFFSTLTEMVFRSLLTMVLALLAWRIISGYIEKKLLEEEPEEPVEEDQDSEWGSAVTRGRAYTLLPMLRKFIGTVLAIMVILTVLSTIGIEIGPLLAGAGVVGLAVGFGAQKLVSDVFSGFFFLLDDAFRVGEYLDAGGVSGAVEGITLRNVLLRHHRGMLQIVPYSELGSITNYMRGGVVVKFNLEFPYDTDIDLVRRIIKKVGQAMLEDEDLGKDFIRPVKSQGVREITNSVMVIRVKFTAQPGTHFVIRREAYRRITEALAAKGIYYAHRKVIVELPDDIKAAEKADMKRIAEAGAAASLTTESLDDGQPS